MIFFAIQKQDIMGKRKSLLTSAVKSNKKARSL